MRFAVAKREGLDEARVAALDDGYEHADLPERDKVVLRFTDAFVLDPHGVPDALRQQLLAHFTPAQVVELTLALAAFLGFAKLRIALGLVPDAMDTREVPTPDVPRGAPG